MLSLNPGIGVDDLILDNQTGPIEQKGRVNDLEEKCNTYKKTISTAVSRLETLGGVEIKYLRS